MPAGARREIAGPAPKAAGIPGGSHAPTGKRSGPHQWQTGPGVGQQAARGCPPPAGAREINRPNPVGPPAVGARCWRFPQRYSPSAAPQPAPPPDAAPQPGLASGRSGAKSPPPFPLGRGPGSGSKAICPHRWASAPGPSHQPPHAQQSPAGAPEKRRSQKPRAAPARERQGSPQRALAWGFP